MTAYSVSTVVRADIVVPKGSSNRTLFLFPRALAFYPFSRSDQGCRSISRWALSLLASSRLRTSWLLNGSFRQKYLMRVPWPISCGQIRMQRRRTLQYHPGRYAFSHSCAVVCMWSGSTYSITLLFLLLSDDDVLTIPCFDWCRHVDTLHSEVRVTPLARVSYTNSLRRTTCRTSSAPTNSVWRAIRPSLTSTCPRYGPRPTIVIVAATRQVSSK
jgi:hypothetical protein